MSEPKYVTGFFQAVYPEMTELVKSFPPKEETILTDATKIIKELRTENYKLRTEAADFEKVLNEFEAENAELEIENIELNIQNNKIKELLKSWLEYKSLVINTLAYKTEKILEN